MKHRFAKIAAIAAAGVLTLGLTLTAAGCSGSGSGAKNPESEVKIGVLVSDVSGEEAQAFRNYYQNYIAKQYTNVTITYSGAMADASQERSQIDQWAAQNYDAVISLSAADRSAQLSACSEAEMYYAIASGMDESLYEANKTNEYFVGQIGPDMQTEYEAGLAMGEYYAEKNVTKVGLYGAFIPNPMHVYRFAGILTGLGLTYDGKTGTDIVAAVGASVETSKIAGDVTVLYMTGYGDTTSSEITAIIDADPDAFLSVGMTTTFFAAQLTEAQIPYADIDSFTTSNGNQMKTGTLEYLAGKYTSSIGPIFAAVLSSVYGAPIRGEGNTAISIGQDYWVATSSEEFDRFQAADSATNPIFTKALLDEYIGWAEYTSGEETVAAKTVSYDDFVTFVTTDRTPAAN